MKTKLIKELNIIVTTKQEQNGVFFEDIKMPKGFRLIKATEIMRFWDCKEFRDVLLKENENELWFFVENLDCYKDKSVAGFIANSDGADLSCGRFPQGSYVSLGVVFVQDVEK